MSAAYNPFLNPSPAREPVAAPLPEPRPTSGEIKKSTERRAGASVADLARQEIARIEQVYRDGLREDMPFSQRLRAAEGLLAIEREEAKLDRAEHSDIEHMTKAQMAREIVELIDQLQRVGLVRVNRPAHDVIDGEVVSDED